MAEETKEEQEKSKQEEQKAEHPIIAEALDEIKSALQDVRGITTHQRRLAFCLSSGAAVLLEQFLKKKNVLKSGITINHLWLKKSPTNTLKLLAEKMTSAPEALPELATLVEKAHELERERDTLAYGKIVDENLLRQKIDAFLEFRKEVEHA